MKKFLLVVLFGASACLTRAGEPQPASAQSGVQSTTQSTTQSTNTVDEIKHLIGTAACSSNAQCRTLPVGAKACGGPEAYLAYSAVQADAARLQALAERARSQRKAENERSGEMSVCRHLSDPGAVCVAGSCQLSTPSTAI